MCKASMSANAISYSVVNINELLTLSRNVKNLLMTIYFIIIGKMKNVTFWKKRRVRIVKR